MLRELSGHRNKPGDLLLPSCVFPLVNDAQCQEKEFISKVLVMDLARETWSDMDVVDEQQS